MNVKLVPGNNEYKIADTSFDITTKEIEEIVDLTRIAYKFLRAMHNLNSVICKNNNLVRSASVLKKIIHCDVPKNYKAAILNSSNNSMPLFRRIIPLPSGRGKPGTLRYICHQISKDHTVSAN
jgi:hypothetical protein